MRVSFGRTKYGAVDETIDVSFAEFAEHLLLCAEIMRAPNDKDSWHWVSPMILRAGATQRRNSDIVRMAAWFAADLDDGNYQLSDLKLRLLGSAWIAWTTTNSHPAAMRWRVIQRLDEEYDPQDHPRLVRWYQAKFPESRFSIEKTRNPSRIYYAPAAWEGATNLFHTEYGHAAKVSAILAMVPPIEDSTAATATATVERTAPNGTAIITQHMLEAAQSKPVGGRMYAMLCQAAKRYRLNGWTLTAQELADEGRLASEMFAPGKARSDIDREAQRAIDWAQRNVTPQSPLERMRARILWERSRKLGN